MALHLKEKTAIEEYILKALKDVSRTNPLRLKAGLRILLTTNLDTFEKICSPSVQSDLDDFKKLLLSPEMFAPVSCQGLEDKQQVEEYVKQYTLSRLNLLDERTSILPNPSMVKSSLLGGERLKSVVHASAMRNVITHAHYLEALEKRFKNEGVPQEKISEKVNRALECTVDLRKAVLDGDVTKVLQNLAVRGVDINYPDEQGFTPLHLAVRENQLEIARLLLTVPHININQVSNTGWTPLHMAARQGHADILDAILAMPDVNPNVVNSDGWSALHWAAWHGFIDTVTVLLTAPGINVNVIDKNGSTPLHWAARNGHHDIIAVLISVPEIAINIQDHEQRTPLHEAASYSHKEAVASLLKSPKIEPNLKDKDGLTALHAAARNGDKDIIELLLTNRDTLIDILDNNGMTPYDWAIKNGHDGVIQYLKMDNAEKPSFMLKLRKFFQKLFK